MNKEPKVIRLGSRKIQQLALLRRGSKSKEAAQQHVGTERHFVLYSLRLSARHLKGQNPIDAHVKAGHFSCRQFVSAAAPTFPVQRDPIRSPQPGTLLLITDSMRRSPGTGYGSATGSLINFYAARACLPYPWRQPDDIVIYIHSTLLLIAFNNSKQPRGIFQPVGNLEHIESTRYSLGLDAKNASHERGKRCNLKSTTPVGTVHGRAALKGWVAPLVVETSQGAGSLGTTIYISPLSLGDRPPEASDDALPNGVIARRRLGKVHADVETARLRRRAMQVKRYSFDSSAGIDEAGLICASGHGAALGTLPALIAHAKRNYLRGQHFQHDLYLWIPAGSAGSGCRAWHVLLEPGSQDERKTGWDGHATAPAAA
ncbi:uncharacterized protein BDZ99DRAFT_496430 [Mytilinidion resinicola]|uniref:Uncharacterized protein n=1 Tax=Mytilinidion resinicola TaxID=574789 RepID=A0A6A6YYC2_9PEZI|nr:uncharacterized protein BDZ99DRAFT_496430 [Mytilinidion resinicola]KAF2813433.1 hypothetical protein BDZ99DRAFT_496430 [Mytilinidion resinicola]